MNLRSNGQLVIAFCMPIGLWIFILLKGSEWVPTTPYFVAVCACGVMAGWLVASAVMRDFAKRWRKPPTAPSGLKDRKRGFLFLCLVPLLLMLGASVLGFAKYSANSVNESSPYWLDFDNRLEDISRREAAGESGEAIERDRKWVEGTKEHVRRMILGRKQRTNCASLFVVSIFAGYCICSLRLRSMFRELTADEETDVT